MIKFERTPWGELKIEITLNHEIVDGCFLYNRFNAASEGKRALMEYIGKAYEDYVNSFAKTASDKEYLKEAFESVKLL
jgi:hypothetical protein